MYRISIQREALKELKALPKKAVVQVSGAIEELSQQPRPAGCKKLRGSQDLWRIRVGDYRVIYTIGDKVQVIEVRRIRHRRDVYE